MSAPGAPRKASTAAQFKKRNEPIELPSGNYMVLKKTSLAGFLQGGNIPNGLMSILQGALAKRGKAEEQDQDAAVAEIMSDPSKLGEMFSAMDAYVCSVALDPRVYPIPEDESDRDDGLLYIDEVEDGDKMFLFQRAMGSTDDLATFREQASSGVESVQSSKVKPMPTKRAVGSRKKA